MIDPSSPSTIEEFTIPTAGSEPEGIAAGSDGDLWFTEATAGQIGQFAPSNPSAMTETPIPNCTACTADYIAAGPDKNLWFTETGANKVGRIKPATHKVSQFSAGPKFGHPGEITAGSNGGLWFIEFAPESSVDIVQEISTGGVLGPSATVPFGDGCCGAITTGPDGDVWVAEAGGNNSVVQFDTTATFVSASPIPSPSGNPAAMTAGPDGNIWMTDDAQGDDGVTGNIDEVTLPHLNLIDVLYLPNRFLVPNEVSLPQQGDTASWLGLNPKLNSITDASGMGLFGSQDSPTTIGSTYSFSFVGAGTYSYRGGSGGTAKVAVPITVQLQPGATDTADVTWASASLPGGVHLRRPGKTPGRCGLRELAGRGDGDNRDPRSLRWPLLGARHVPVPVPSPQHR
jgi:hypothetical protein